MNPRSVWLLCCLALFSPFAHAQLTINGGASGTLNFGTVGYGTSFFTLTPAGGSGSYAFDLTGPAIPGFRVANRPDVPNTIAASAEAVLIGLPTVSGTFTSTIRLTDTVTSVTLSRLVTFTVSDVDVYGLVPSGYGVGDTISFPFTGIGGSGSYTFALVGGTIPAGTTFDPINAILTGTLTVAQPPTAFSIQVTDNGTGKTFTRTFSPSVSPLRLLPASPATPNPRVLPTATQSLLYNYQLLASGCSGGPCTFSVVPGDALPAGLTMTSTGLISGSPINTTYNFTFTVIISDPAGDSITPRLGIFVIPQTPIALGFNNSINSLLDIGDFPAGQDQRANDVAGFGGVPPYTFSAPQGSLPQGVILRTGYSTFPGDNPDAAVFRSRSLATGSYQVPITVRDSVGNSATGTISFRISSIGLFYIFLPANGGPTATLNVPYSQALIPVGGTAPYSASPSNFTAGMGINNSGFVSGTPQESGRFLPLSVFLSDSAGHSYTSGGNITVSSPVGSIPLSLNGNTFGFTEGTSTGFTISATGSTVPNPNYAITVVSGSLPPGMTLLTGSDFNTNGNTSLAAQLDGIPSTPGTYSFILNITDGAGGVGQRQYTIFVSQFLTILTASMAPGLVGQPYSQSFDARGTPPYTFSMLNIGTNSSTPPPGLLFDATTGILSGTPTSSLATNVEIFVRDANSTSSARIYAFNIYSLEITTPNILPTVTAARAYSQALSINPPGAYTWTATGLPAGLTIDLHTGVISGTIANGSTGTLSVNVTAANATTAVVKNFTLFSKTLSSTWALSGTGGLLGDILVNALVTTILTPSGGTPPYNVALDSGSLPPGLDIVPETNITPGQNFGRFALAGVATTAGSYTFRVRYSDAAGLSIVRPLRLNIRTIALTTSSVGPAAVNQPFTAHLFGSGAPGPFTFALSPAFTPPILGGLTLSSSGVLSGTPTQTGSFSFNVDVTSGALTRRQVVSYTVEAVGNRAMSFGSFVSDVSMGVNFLTGFLPSGGAGTQTWSIVSGTLPPGLQLLTGANLPPGFPATEALLTGAPSLAGDYKFQLRVDDSTGNFGIRDQMLHVSPLRNGPINHPYSFTAVPPPMQVGTPYNYPITMLNSAAPVGFVDVAGGVSTLMPTGVSMSSAGVISGTPSDGGAGFLQTFVATDANGTTRQSLTSFTVYPTGGMVGVVGALSVNLSDATLGSAYSFNLNDLLNPGFGIGPFTWMLDSGAFPTGLGISGNFIVGTPTAAGPAGFSVLVTDSQGTQHLVGPLTLNVSTMSITAGSADSLAPAAQNSTYGALFQAAGATGPFTFRTAYFSDMPAGLSLASNGILSGIPTIQGPFQLWIEAVDAATGAVFRKRYVLNVGAPGAPPAAISAAPNNLTIAYTIGNPAPVPVPINVTNSGGSSFTFTATASTASGGTWLTATLSLSPSPVPATVTAGFNVTGLTAGTYNGAITLTSATASNSPLVIPVTLNVSAIPVCGFSLSASSATILASGGPLGFGVNTNVGCDWTAMTTDTWITVKTPSGTGPGTVSLNADPNPNSAQRTGTVTVQGLPFMVTEFGSSCAFSISPSSIGVTAGATSLPVTVNASGPACGWTASGLSLFGPPPPPPAPHTGSGSVTVIIGANTGTSRSGTATIAGKTFTVNQAGAGCTYSLSASNGSAPWSGGSVAPVVNMTAGAGCSWATDAGPAWVHVGSGQSGTGNGLVTLSVDPNSGIADRTANVLIGGQSFLIAQPGAPCSFSIVANNQSQAMGGGAGSVNITSSAGTCSWIASSNAGWLTPSAATGTGNSSINFAVAANAGTNARSAVLTVAGQGIVVNQNGATCAYSLQSPSANLPSAGGPGAVVVIAATGCAFTASSNVPWAHITSGASSTGTAGVGYSVDANATGAARSGALTIAGITFPISQAAAAACVVTLGSSGFSAGEFGGTSTLTYTTSVSACTPSIQSFSSWVTITGTTAVGVNGTVNFSVAANTFSATRSAVIRVGDVEFTITQAPSSCMYTLTSFGASFGRLGGDGAIPMNFAPAACGAPAVLVTPASPDGMISLGPASSAPGTYTQNYSVTVFQTFINYVRSAQLLVQGQIYTVKQNSF